VAFAFGGTAFVALMMMVFKRCHQRRIKSDLDKPLLVSGAINGNGEDEEMAIQAEETRYDVETGALLSSDVPWFDDQTGSPINAAAREAVSREWRQDVPRGQLAHVTQVPYADLDRATAGFSKLNRLGRGASCFVYKARLYGTFVACKHLSSEPTPGATDINPETGWDAKQFEAEMGLLEAVSHPNICRLLAFSTDGPQRCLVLELCEGGTLDVALAARGRCRYAPALATSLPPPPTTTAATATQPAGVEEGPEPLAWQHRVKLAHGIARAVGHLHSLSPPMLHRDLKSSNVLLDARGNAKVADFGTVREWRGEQNRTHATTGLAVGTPYAMPPEYKEYGHVSMKTDSYALSILLVELLTGHTGMGAVALHHGEPDLFEEMHQHADERAGAWPTWAIEGLAEVAQLTIKFHARKRADVLDVLPRLAALAGRADNYTARGRTGESALVMETRALN
jgi:hypothetical protein